MWQQGGLDRPVERINKGVFPSIDETVAVATNETYRVVGRGGLVAVKAVVIFAD